MLNSVSSVNVSPTARSNIVPPSRFEVAEGKSIILAADVPHGNEPVGWSRDGHVINEHTQGHHEQPSRFRAFERLQNGEASADYDCFLARQMPDQPTSAAPSTIRAYLAIDSTCEQDSGCYELLVRTKSGLSSSQCLSVAGAMIRVVASANSSNDAKKRKVDEKEGSLSSELPSVHYPHPMAPVFIRQLPEKVYIDAGDTVQLGCRLWGLPANFVNWTSDSSSPNSLLVKKAAVA